jgi:hypothetical protein
VVVRRGREVEEEEIVLYLPGFCIYRPALQGCLLLKGTW